MLSKIIPWILIIAITLGFMFIAFDPAEGCYIVDKGWVNHYVDEHGIYHDDVFWFVAGNLEYSYVFFVSPQTWSHYAVGEKFAGPSHNFMYYKGDADILQHGG